MSKREFLLSSAALSAATVLPAGVASALQPGKEYRLVEPPQRTAVEAGQIEVLEFFWYACPHCYSLHPFIETWAAKLPDDVVFRHVHVQFRSPSHQQIHYTLEAMGKDKALGVKVFEAIHRERKRMRDESEIQEWAKANGLDEQAFMKVYSSFGVRTQMKRASQATAAFGVDGVPMIAVNGKYLTSPSMTGSNEAALRVTDALIEMERKAA